MWEGGGWIAAAIVLLGTLIGLLVTRGKNKQDGKLSWYDQMQEDLVRERNYRETLDTKIKKLQDDLDAERSRREALELELSEERRKSADLARRLDELERRAGDTP